MVTYDVGCLDLAAVSKNLKCRTSQVARIGMFLSPSVAVLVVHCLVVMHYATVFCGDNIGTP